jgi:hypothetical protein
MHTGLFQFGIGCLGGFLAELLHWQRILIRGKLPKYASNPFYWIITTSLIASGGALAVSVSPSSSPPLQLLLIGIAGPKILMSLAQTYEARSKAASKDVDGPFLGGRQRVLSQALSDLAKFMAS